MTLTTGTVTNLAAAEGSATAQVVGQGTATIQITPEMRELLQPLQRVSIPFRADTGFELGTTDNLILRLFVSIPFRADTGFELPAFFLL